MPSKCETKVLIVGNDFLGVGRRRQQQRLLFDYFLAQQALFTARLSPSKRCGAGKCFNCCPQRAGYPN